MENPAGQSLKLKGKDNWNVWKFQITIILRSKNVFEVVTGKSAKPIWVSGNEQERQRHEAKLQEWVRKDSKAQETIVMGMQEGPMGHIITCESSEEMWDKLLSVYEQKSEVSLHLIQQRFFNLKYESEGISKYMSKIEEIKTQLKQMGEEISENMLMTKILMSLPDSYKHFISAWESVPLRDRNLNDLTSRLLIEEQRINVVEDSQEALVAKNFTNERRQVKCYMCNKYGHMKKDCFYNKTSKKETQVCHYCKKPGHFINKCRFKAAKDKEENSKAEALVSSALISENISRSDWYLDSGASEHMCCNKNQVSNFEELKVPKLIKIGNGTNIKATGKGIVKVNSIVDKQIRPMELKDVLYVPDLTFNLLSVSSTLDKGYRFVSDKEKGEFINKKGQTCARATRDGKLYKMNFQTCGYANAAVVQKKSLKVWHEKLAHQNIRQVKRMLNKNNIKYDETEEFTCEPCIKGKQHRLPFGTSSSKTSKTCEIIHADVCGPMEESSLGGSRYFLLIKDDYSHYKSVYFMKHKSEVKQHLKYFLLSSKKETGNEVKILRSDNGLEFDNQEVKSLLKEKGIRFQKTVPYTPEQNGKAEREMRTIVEAARTMLLAKGMDKSFWGEAVNTAVYTLNRTGTSTIENKTPYEIWYNQRENIKNLQVFGTEAYVHIPKEKRRKLDAKSKKGIFVGYEENTKGYRIYFPENRKIECARDVNFSNHEQNGKIQEVQTEEGQEQQEIVQGEDKIIEENVNKMCINEDDTNQEENENQTKSLRNRNKLKKPQKYQDYETCFLVMNDEDEPETYEEAMERNDSKQWKLAIQTELDSLKENNTWTEVENNNNCNIIENRWVFKIKRNKEGKISQYKARLVAKGFQQKDNMELAEIYSPVAKLTTMRVLLAIAVQENFPVYQMDVKSAFLYGDIEEEVFMYLPEGLQIIEENKICKLNKSIYGLKKSPRYWNEKFNSVMECQNFERSKNDLCLYTKITEHFKTYVLLYVDDLLIIGSDEGEVNKLKSVLSLNFKMKDLGRASNYLGINIEQDISAGTITINQSANLKGVLHKYGMKDCKSVSTPMDTNFNHEHLKRQSPESQEIETMCRRIIGSLMYAMLGSRPDLSASINILSRYQASASNDLLTALKRILRYVKGTVNLNLIFKRQEKSAILTGYVDSDWGGDKCDRKSTSGYTFMIKDCVVSWSSKKQSTVALSSTEAEYIALSVAICEACWLRKLLCDLKINNIDPIVLFEDNQSAIRVAKNFDNSKRLKHIDIRYCFVNEKINNNIIDVQYLDTENQIADVFTKPLSRVKFEKFCKCLNLIQM